MQVYKNLDLEMERTGAFGQLKKVLLVWKPAFTTRQTKLYRLENERLLDQNTLISAQQIVEAFLGHLCTNDIHQYLYRNLPIGNFIKEADILRLTRQPSTFGDTVLVDERNNEGVDRADKSGKCRVVALRLSPQGLYRALSQNRLPSYVGNQSSAVAVHPPPAGGVETIDAERRLIYIPDLDSYSALAIVATIPRTQASFFRDFLYTYLSFRAAIRINIQSTSPLPTGYSTFALEVHLPYYAFRRMRYMKEDRRTGANGKALRRSEEVIYLDSEGQTPSMKQGEQDFIYEAQISVMVTGLDAWVWAAYCFVDVYFKGSQHNESIQHYANSLQDPHSWGKYPANLPVWDPRAYFLRTLSARMEQVKIEWNNSVLRLMSQIKPCIYAFTREDTEAKKAGELPITQQKGFKWTIRALRQFSHLLSKTIAAWDRFEDGEIRYFFATESENLADPIWGTYLTAINKDVDDFELKSLNGGKVFSIEKEFFNIPDNHDLLGLRDLRTYLQDQTELFENMTNSQATHAQHAETIIAREQNSFVRALTIITICYLPLTLACAVFSMQTILPATIKFRDWIYTLITLSVATAVLVFNIPSLTTLFQTFPDWMDRKRAAIPNWATIMAFIKSRGVRPVETAGDETEEDENEGQGSDDEDDGIELSDIETTPESMV